MAYFGLAKLNLANVLKAFES